TLDIAKQPTAIIGYIKTDKENFGPDWTISHTDSTLIQLLSYMALLTHRTVVMSQPLETLSNPGRVQGLQSLQSQRLPSAFGSFSSSGLSFSTVCLSLLKILTSVNLQYPPAFSQPSVTAQIFRQFNSTEVHDSATHSNYVTRKAIGSSDFITDQSLMRHTVTDQPSLLLVFIR
ncbi:hypothetical protein STEG23_000521, partial [Scotinomys teguina]